MTRDADEPGLLLPDWLRDNPDEASKPDAQDPQPGDAERSGTQRWDEPPPRPTHPFDPDTILTDDHLPDWLKIADKPPVPSIDNVSANSIRSQPPATVESRDSDAPAPNPASFESEPTDRVRESLSKDVSNTRSGEIESTAKSSASPPITPETDEAISAFDAPDSEVEIPLLWLATLAVFVIVVLIAAIIGATG